MLISSIETGEKIPFLVTEDPAVSVCIPGLVWKEGLFLPCVFLGDMGLCECSPATEHTCVKCSFLQVWCLNNLTLAL